MHVVAGMQEVVSCSLQSGWDSCSGMQLREQCATAELELHLL
jgi:hypothetical protein